MPLSDSDADASCTGLERDGIVRVCCVCKIAAKLQPPRRASGSDDPKGLLLHKPNTQCPLSGTVPNPSDGVAEGCRTQGRQLPKKGVIRHPSETMAEAWDPVTGRNISEDELLSLIAAAGGATAMDEPCAMPDFSPSASPSDMLNVHLYNADGDCLGGLTSRDKHECASRVCSFLQNVPPGGRVTIACGNYTAIALRHPNGQTVQTSFKECTSPFPPGVLNYNANDISLWALGICSMFIGAFESKLKTQHMLKTAEERRRYAVEATPASAVA